MFEGDELVEHWRFATVRFATADELATVLAGLLDLRDLRLGDVHAAMVSAVVPTLAHEYEQVIERYFGGRGLLVGSDIKSGMPIRIDRPQELGADRLVNAIAAYDRVGGACIAVDFGTAINYDVVSAAGRVPRRGDLARHRDLARGAGRPRGAAAAGRHRGAAPRDRQGHARRPSRPASSTGSRARWTPSSAASGRSSARRPPRSPPGGFAGAIVPFCEQVDEVDDRLTLQGLKLIWERNSRLVSRLAQSRVYVRTRRGTRPGRPGSPTSLRRDGRRSRPGDGRARAGRGGRRHGAADGRGREPPARARRARGARPARTSTSWTCTASP